MMATLKELRDSRIGDTPWHRTRTMLITTDAIDGDPLSALDGLLAIGDVHPDDESFVVNNLRIVERMSHQCWRLLVDYRWLNRPSVVELPEPPANVWEFGEPMQLVGFDGWCAIVACIIVAIVCFFGASL